MRRSTVWIGLMATCTLVVAAEPAWGMKKHFGRVADPSTGAAVPGATVLVLGAGTDNQASIFEDSGGKNPSVNPVLADAGGRFSFYAPNGRYRLRISSPAGKVLYDLDDVPIFDPREPRTIVATEQQPALSLHTLGQWADVNLPLVMERRDPKGELVGASWRILCQLTEKGWVLCYNYRRRGGASGPSDKGDERGFEDMHRLDLPQEPSLDGFGSNDADDGMFGWPGLMIFGGGEWFGEAHVTSMNARLAMPQGKESAGIAVQMNAPKGLSAGDVVALDARSRSRVVPVKAQRARLPFVVTKANETEVFVLVRGLAWVRVDGPVEPGDILVTSTKPGQAMADNSNSDPSRSIGIAVMNADEGWTLARVLRIGKKPERQ